MSVAAGDAYDKYSDEEEDAEMETGEEEEEDEDEVYNLKMFGISPALPIPDGEPDWESGEPQTAEEYLRRVRAEAAACPRVVRVEFDPSKLKKNSQAAPSTSQGAATGAPAYVGADAVPLSTHEATHIAQQPPQEPASSLQGVTKQGVAEKLNMTSPGSGEAGAPRPRRAAYVTRLLAAGSLPQAPPWAQPSHTWVRQFVCDFKQLRLWLVEQSAVHAAELGQSMRLPHAHDLQGWDTLCFGGDPLQSIQQGKGEVCEAGGINTQDAKHAGRGHGSDHQPDTLPLAAPGQTGSGAAEAPSGSAAGSAHQQSGVAGAARGGRELAAASASVNSQQTAPAVASDSGPGAALGEEEAVRVQGIEQVPGPMLRTVLGMEQVAVASVLCRHVEVMEETGVMNTLQAQWLFALAAVLEKPVHAGVVSTLRALLRKVAHLRGGLSAPTDPQLPCLNTLAVVAGAYFGQDEQLVAMVSDMDLP